MIDAISPAASVGVLDQSTRSTGDLHQLSMSFDRMMTQQPEALSYNDPLHNEHSTVATAAVKSGDEAMRHTNAEMDRFIADAPNLTMPEMISRHMNLAMEVAMNQFQFNACTYVAQSAKTGLQTLMKNQ